MNRSNGLSIALRPVRKGSQLKSAAAGIPVSLMMLSGMAAILCGWFPGAGLAWWQLAPAMAAMALALWLLRLTGRGRTILSGLLILVIAAVLVIPPILRLVKQVRKARSKKAAS